MVGPGSGVDLDDRFRVLYAAHLNAILGYALRRVAAPEDAADVVAETFLIAWRRCADVPPGGEARLWLYGVARRVLANHVRVGTVVAVGWGIGCAPNSRTR